MVCIYTFFSTGQSCTNTTINSSRLYSGGSLTHTGQVQICQCEGDGAGECSWMRVAAIGSNRQFWSWKNSLVVCRQLGFLGVQNPVQSSRYCVISCTLCKLLPNLVSTVITGYVTITMHTTCVTLSYYNLQCPITVAGSTVNSSALQRFSLRRH